MFRPDKQRQFLHLYGNIVGEDLLFSKKPTFFHQPQWATTWCFENVVSGTPKGSGTEGRLFMLNPNLLSCSQEENRQACLNGKLDNSRIMAPK
jgi:hypothetical protein